LVVSMATAIGVSFIRVNSMGNLSVQSRRGVVLGI
jgi:hypothetical protein